jgi:hypothetical protein
MRATAYLVPEVEVCLPERGAPKFERCSACQLPAGLRNLWPRLVGDLMGIAKIAC